MLKNHCDLALFKLCTLKITDQKKYAFILFSFVFGGGENAISLFNLKKHAICFIAQGDQ